MKTSILVSYLNWSGPAKTKGVCLVKSADGKRCVTISLEMKFISAAKLGDKLIAKVKVQKKTKTLVFITCEILNADGIVAVTSGVWKILKINK